PAHRVEAMPWRAPARSACRHGFPGWQPSPAARTAPAPPSAASHPEGTQKNGSFDERHLIDFAQRGHAFEHALDRRLTQKPHAVFARSLLDFRRRPLFENHLANAIGEVEKFANRLAALVAGPVALDTA